MALGKGALDCKRQLRMIPIRYPNQDSQDLLPRTNLNVDSAEHFVNFLFGSDLLQDVAYGKSTLELADGSIKLLTKSVLTLSKTRIISDIKNTVV